MRARGILRRVLLGVSLALLAAGCEKRDPQAERRFELLMEENARLFDAVAAVDAKQAGAKFHPESGNAKALGALNAENDRLRAVLVQRERAAALAKNKTVRGEIERQVEILRGLTFKTPVDYNILTRAEIRQTVTGKLDEVFSEQEFRDTSAALASIGLLPEKYALRERYIELLSEQIAAFYDQHQHKLFMYEDASLDNVQNQVVLAHELTHALQDQSFGLHRLPLEIKTNDDRAAAASALVEGDATLLMGEYMLRNLSLKAIKDSAAGALTQNMQQLAAAPRFLREMLVFPYLRGQEFCAALVTRGGFDAVSQAYARPPTSTAQILHPEKYFAEPREEPVAIAWADSTAGGKSANVDNVVGEMGLRILFSEWLDEATGLKAAAGWRGDRYLSFDHGSALVWRSAWATELDATEFFEAERQLLEKRHHLTNPRVGDRSYEADQPRFIRLLRTPANEVVLIDAGTKEWADALGPFAVEARVQSQ